MDQIRLTQFTGPEWVVLREITGVEEQSITSTSTLDAINLLESLLVSNYDSSLQQGEVYNLTSWDREQMLAAVYIRTYGAKIESTIKCRQCGEDFDMDFDLEDLLNFLNPVERETSGIKRLDDGTFQLAEDISFRLPTGVDECAVIGFEPEKAREILLERCIQGNHESALRSKYFDDIQSAMETLSPLVDTELDARCPECDHGQKVHFDLQHYLLSAIKGERKHLMQEIHALASSYGWSLSEILSLPRSQRRTLSGMVESEDGSFI